MRDGFDGLIAFIIFIITSGGILLIGIPTVIISCGLIWGVSDTYKNAKDDNYILYIIITNIVLIILMIWPGMIIINNKYLYIVFAILELIVLITTIVISKRKKKLKEIQGIDSNEVKEIKDEKDE